MKMNKTKQALLQFLPALAFSSAVLAAVHMLTFVWLTAFVYRSNIRGYVPAGLTGLMLLGLATLLLLFRLSAVARRRQSRSTPYVLGGCLAVPFAVFGCSIYAGLLLSVLGHTWQKDVAISSVGALLCSTAALVCRIMWLSKRADNNALNRTSESRAEARLSESG